MRIFSLDIKTKKYKYSKLTYYCNQTKLIEGYKALHQHTKILTEDFLRIRENGEFLLAFSIKLKCLLFLEDVNFQK